MPLNIPQYESLVNLIPFINMGQEYRIPVTERAKQMEAAESVRGGIGDFDPTGLTPLSVRSFAKKLDPELVKSLAGKRTGTTEELYNLYDAYMKKYDLISPLLTDTKRRTLLNHMVDSLGAQGLQGLHGLIKARVAGKVKDFGPRYKYPESQFPFYSFGYDDVNRAWWPGNVITKDPKSSIRTRITVDRSTSKISTLPDDYWEAFPEEIAHTASGAEATRIGLNPDTLTEAKEVARDLLGSPDILTPVDVEILKRYLVNPRNTAWKLGYRGPGGEEYNLAEFMEQFIRPAFQPRRAKIGIGTSKETPPIAYTHYANQKPVYWQMWEREPEIFQKVHELLDLPIPKVIRRKRQLGEFAITPEDKASISVWLSDIEKAKQGYYGQVLGKPATPSTPPGSP